MGTLLVVSSLGLVFSCEYSFDRSPATSLMGGVEGGGTPGTSEGWVFDY